MTTFNQEGQTVGQQVNVGIGPMLSERHRTKVEALASHFALSVEVVIAMAIDDLYLTTFKKSMTGKGEKGE